MPEPSAQPLIEADVVGRLMGQPLLARFPMEGSISGHHRSPHRGSSVEFAEYRNYVPGDDIRRLDWRVFARTDRYYLKEFEAETNLRCYVVLDCSGSMGFAGEHGTRLDYAKRLRSRGGWRGRCPPRGRKCDPAPARARPVPGISRSARR